jgi:small subunit ribosomal protein S17
MKQKKSIGLEVTLPKKTCDDKHCPFHSGFGVRGRTQICKVVKKGGTKSATVSWTRLFYIPKYQRYEKRISKVSVHLPPCLDDIKVGDKVKIIETRPISKSKNFVILEKI